MTAHIVVINHSPDLLELFQDLLEYAGYRVTTHRFAPQTVAEVAQAQPAVLIVDYPGIQEPEAWALIEQLHQDATTRHIPLVVSTTSPTLERDHGAWLAAHQIPILPKPFGMDTLVDLVARLCCPSRRTGESGDDVRGPTAPAT
jgi:CheY-like chemotaxis protein